MKIQNVKPNDLKPYENNARTHSEEQIEQIAKSITEFGFTTPILLDQNLNILAGHGRVEAAKLLKLKTIPALKLDHLTEEQKRALIITDNKLAANAEWDYGLLKLEANELKELGFDVELLGFSDTELSAFFGDVVNDPSGEWLGMPGFNQDDLTAFRTIHVHFFDQEGVDSFAKLLKKNVTEKTKYIWWPEQIIGSITDKEWVDVESNEG